MDVSDLQLLYDYNYWANGKLLKVIETLTPEELNRDVCGAYGSIRKTLVHMLSAEWGWLARAGGPERGPKLKPEDFPTLDSIKETWSKVERWMRDFISTKASDDLRRAVTFHNEKGEPRTLSLQEMLQHAANHNVHHRGQVSMILRMMGHAPGNVDLLFYFAEKYGKPVW
ncbi:MAG TPA: DinB family protein [Blastocatellia bacterium]|nr:DinB family protein [Blastocatellia bacterium]